MNPDDYDEDGNNIVPCPICGDVHCPSKEDGKCPEEDAFVKWHEDVETVAEVVYDFMPYDEAGTKPKWTPHGNSLKQDEARTQARAIINKLREKDDMERTAKVLDKIKKGFGAHGITSIKAGKEVIKIKEND